MTPSKMPVLIFSLTYRKTWTNEILKLLLKDKEIESIGAAGEDEAMAICAGASLGGKRPMVLMEGSGYSTGTYVMSRLGLMHHVGWLMLSSHAGGIGEVAYYHWDVRLVENLIADGAADPPLCDSKNRRGEYV